MLHSPEVSPILVIEDQPNIQRVIRTMLTSSNLGLTQDQLLFASTINEARFLLFTEELEPRSIIAELRMPDEEGVGFLEQVRSQDSPVREIPIIIFTTDRDPDVESYCRTHLGIEDYFHKPLTSLTERRFIQALTRIWHS